MDTFQLQHFLGQLFSETSVEYSFAKFIDLLTVSSSLMSVYSHKKCNVLLICLNRVLSPAITSLEMTTGVEKGLRNLLCFGNIVIITFSQYNLINLICVIAKIGI